MACVRVTRLAQLRNQSDSPSLGLLLISEGAAGMMGQRRLLSSLEDSSVLPHISVAKEVRDKMGLPLWLAAKYTSVVFLLHLRFQARHEPDRSSRESY